MWKLTDYSCAGRRSEHSPLEGASREGRSSGKKQVRLGGQVIQTQAEATKIDVHIGIFLLMSKAHRKQLEGTLAGQIWAIFKIKKLNGLLRQ